MDSVFFSMKNIGFLLLLISAVANAQINPQNFKMALVWRLLNFATSIS